MTEILYVITVEQSLIGHCLVMEPIIVLPAQDITYTFGLVLENSLGAGLYDIVIVVHMNTKVVKITNGFLTFQTFNPVMRQLSLLMCFSKVVIPM